MQTDSLEQLRLKLAEFAAVRDWEQFHSPKNLSMALIAEAAELVEHFQWMTEADSMALSEQKSQAVGEELADILIYLIRVADRLGIDLLDATEAKILRNEHRYPASKVRGKALRAADIETLQSEP